MMADMMANIRINSNFCPNVKFSNGNGPLKFPFKNMFSDLSKSLQAAFSISNNLCMQAIIDTDAANLEYIQLGNSIDRKSCEKCRSLEIRLKDFEKALKDKDELLFTFSKCISRNHDSYDAVTQKAIECQKVTKVLVGDEDVNADDTVTEIESSLLNDLKPKLRPGSPVMKSFRTNMKRSRSRLKCFSSKRSNNLFDKYNTTTQFDGADFLNFETVSKPTKPVKPKAKTDLKYFSRLEKSENSIVLLSDSDIDKSQEATFNDKPNLNEATLEPSFMEELNENKIDSFIDRKSLTVLNQLNVNVMNNNINSIPDIAISKSAENLSEDEKMKKKTKWSLTKSREPTNDTKFKQTLLTTSIIEEKVDMSTLECFNGGLLPREKKHDTSNKLHRKSNTEDILFNPVVTSTAYDFPQENSKIKIPEKCADMENSFDVIPGDSPKYKYKRDAVRKKVERRKLPGQECDQCCNFYERERANLGETQVLKMIEKCSRHRDKFSIRSNTPPGLWNPTFSDEETDN